MRDTIKIFNDKYELTAEPNMQEEIAIESCMTKILSFGRMDVNGYDQLVSLDKAISDNYSAHNKSLTEKFGDQYETKKARLRELEAEGKYEDAEYKSLKEELLTDYLEKAVRLKDKKDGIYCYAFFQVMSVKPVTDEFLKDFQNNQYAIIKELGDKLKLFRTEKGKTP
jgi:hypothetical protein